jgi:hypothetical protein
VACILWWGSVRVVCRFLLTRVWKITVEYLNTLHNLACRLRYGIASVWLGLATKIRASPFPS